LFEELVAVTAATTDDKGAVMPGSHADEIVGDYYESDDWAQSFAEDAESEPDLDLPPLPPPRPQAA
jgi:hypothetical protein